MNCLCCGKPVVATEALSGWHSRCVRSFFGTGELPSLEVTSDSLAALAEDHIAIGRTVTGVQRKLSIHLSCESESPRLTMIGYPAGYILKPPSPDYPELPQLEHQAMAAAERVGIRTVPHALIPLADGVLAYITKRVDRRPKDPHAIPMEDLCQLSERLTEDKYRGSYEQVARVVARYSSRPGVDLSELFLIVVFSFVIGNGDMHLKNFSLFRPTSDWVLAPAYDLLSTAMVLPDDPDETALTINGRKRRLSRRDFELFGAAIGMHSKAVHGLLDSLVRSKLLLGDEIRRSFLSPSTVDALLDLVAERIDRLR